MFPSVYTVSVTWGAACFAGQKQAASQGDLASYVAPKKGTPRIPHASARSCRLTRGRGPRRLAIVAAMAISERDRRRDKGARSRPPRYPRHTDRPTPSPRPQGALRPPPRRTRRTFSPWRKCSTPRREKGAGDQTITGACWRWETNPTQAPATPNGGGARDEEHYGTETNPMLSNAHSLLNSLKRRGR